METKLRKNERNMKKNKIFFIFPNESNFGIARVTEKREQNKKNNEVYYFICSKSLSLLYQE